MSKPTDIRILKATSRTEHFDYRTPIKFGGRAVNDVVLFDVAVEVETRDGRRAEGFGSMTMGNVWDGRRKRSMPTPRSTPWSNSDTPSPDGRVSIRAWAIRWKSPTTWPAIT